MNPDEPIALASGKTMDPQTAYGRSTDLIPYERGFSTSTEGMVASSIAGDDRKRMKSSREMDDD